MPSWLKGAQGFDLTMTGRQIIDLGFFKRITSRPLKEPAFNVSRLAPYSRSACSCLISALTPRWARRREFASAHPRIGSRI